MRTVSNFGGRIDVTLFSSKTRWDPTNAWAEMLEFNSADEWTQLAAQANTYQVSIYAMQASGLGSMAKTNMMRARTSAETGGQAILDTNDLSEPFGSMVEDTLVGQTAIPMVVELLELEQDPGREYLYDVELPLHGRNYRVGVAVRDDVSGDASYISQRVLTVTDEG